MRHIVLSLVFCISLLAEQPFNSNLLSQRAIDPNILNTTLSSTRQNVAYRMQIQHQKTSESLTTDFNYFIIVDPYPSYGTELQMQIQKSEIDSINTSDIQSTLDQLMGIQLYIQHGDLYDKESFTLLNDDKENTIISFHFKKDALPKELKHFREMQGFVYIVDGILQKILIKNNKRLVLRDIEVQNYEKITYFKVVSTGGYLMSSESLLIEGLYKDKPYKETLQGKVVQYWDSMHQEVTFEQGRTKKTINLDNELYEVISVDLDRVFPLLGKEARKAGYDLPKPFGITLINMFQDTTMHMTSFELDGIDIDFNKVLDGDSLYKSITYAPLLRADIWVLPFVSFSVILGATETTTNVTLVSDSGWSIPPLIPSFPDREIIAPGAKLNLDPFATNALLYGLGATVAGGFDNYFTTIDFQYIIAYTEAADVAVDMMIITPLIGYTFNEYSARVFVGAQYQKLAQSLTFNISDDSGNTLSGVIGLDSEEWAGVIGTDYSFTRHWSANLLYSKGIDRTNAILGIAYRF